MFRRFLESGQHERSTPNPFPLFGTDTRIPPTVGQTYVDTKGALAISGAWRAVKMIVDDVSTMPLHAYVVDENGKRRLTSAEAPSLIRKPNALQTRRETIAQLVYSLLLRGNAYALLGDFDDDFLPRQFEVLDPDTVAVSREDGVITYTIGDETYGPSEILHIRNSLTPPGEVEGLSTVAIHRQTFARLLEMDAYGARNWTDSAVPGVALKIDDPDLTAPEAAVIQNNWVSAHGRSRKPAVVGGNVEIEVLSFSPEDAQYLQSREHSLQEIANIFNIPGYRLGAPGTSGTYQNAQQDEAWYLKHSLSWILVAIEDALEALVPEGIEVQFNANALLRMTTAERYEAHKVGLDAGFLTTPEVREMEDLPPLPDGGLNPQALARTIQMIYLGVGKVISADEARDILNLAGADLKGSLEVPEVPADNTPVKDAA